MRTLKFELNKEDGELRLVDNIRFVKVNVEGIPNGICGICSALVGGWLVVHGIKVKRQGSQYKVLFPERKLYGDVYKPVVTALNPEYKKEVDSLILDAFYKALEEK